MKLLTHNMLESHIKGVQKRFPLGIEAETVETTEQELNPAFLRHVFPKLHWGALHGAAATLGVELPQEATEEMLDDEEFVRQLHHALMEVHVLEGSLVCPETGRKFPINKGIPNLLLNEDEC
mmetsp:Transcript_13919/g.39583  ORF Transcript_13919/g.39583 Transcript_13919/m.39583 type:complete len:122 (+) Transcript_13919:3-368(+)